MIAPAEPPRAEAELARLASAGLATGGGLIANGLFTFALAELVARAAGPAGTGEFYSAVAVFSILTVIAQLGTDWGTLRILPGYLLAGRTRAARLQMRIALVPVAVVSAIATLALVVIALTRVSDGGERDALLAVSPSIIPGALAGAVFAGTRAMGKTMPYVVCETIAKPGLRALGVAVVVVLAPHNVAAAVLVWGTVATLSTLAGWETLRRLFARREPDTEHCVTADLAREYWKFTAPRALGAALGVALLWLDVVLLELLRGPAAAGVYSVAVRYLAVGTLALTAAGMVLGPQVSALFAEGAIDRVDEVYKTATTWLCAASLPIVVVCVAFAPALMRAFGSEYVRGAPALAILSAAIAVNLVAGPVNIVLLMGGGSIANLLNTAVGVAVNIVLNLVLIPHLAIDGAALAWAASIVITNVMALVQVRARWRIDPFSPGLGVVAILALGIMGSACVLARSFDFQPTVDLPIVAAALCLYAYGLWREREPLRLHALAAVVTSRNARVA